MAKAMSSLANVGCSNEVGALISCSLDIRVASFRSRQFDLFAHDKVGRIMSVEVGVVVADAKKKHQASRSKTSEKKTTAVAAKKPDHPSYADMIKQALIALKERGGSSRQAILKYLMANFKLAADENAVNTRLKAALRNGVKSELLKQSTGSGASGSFRLGVDAAKKEKKAAVVQQEKVVVVAKPKKAGKLVAVETVKKTARKTAAATAEVGGTKGGKKKMEVKKQSAKPKRAKASPTKKKAVPMAAVKKPSTKTRSTKK